MLGQAARISVQLLSVVVLARLLDPGAYGLFALALAVVSLGEVFRDFGLSTAAIQAPTITRDQQSNLFWLNLATGSLLAVVCVLGAPILDSLTDHTEAVHLLRVMAVMFVLNGAVSQYRADLTRNLRFEALVLSDVGGPVVGVIVAIVAAASGWGVWALAVQQIVGVLGTTVLAVALAGWVPGLPNRRGDVRSMMNFGIGMAGTQLVGYFNNYIDTLTIGFRIGPEALGVYDRAYQVLMKTINQFRNPTMGVAVPILSRLEPGSDAAGRMLVRGQIALGYTIVAGAAFAAGASDPIIELALGPQWAASKPVFAVLAIAAGLQTVGFVAAWVFVSRGLTSRYFFFSAGSLAVRVVLVLVGSRWGIVGVAVGYAAAPAIAMPLGYVLLARWTALPLRALLQGAVRVVACATLSGAGTFLLQRELAWLPPAVQLISCMPAAVLVYVVLAVASKPVRSDLVVVVAFARAALSARRSSRVGATAS